MTFLLPFLYSLVSLSRYVVALNIVCMFGSLITAPYVGLLTGIRLTWTYSLLLVYISGFDPLGWLGIESLCPLQHYPEKYPKELV